VKTQIRYAANLYGNVEEEHAGGALALPVMRLATCSSPIPARQRPVFAEVLKDYKSIMERAAGRARR